MLLRSVSSNADSPPSPKPLPRSGPGVQKPHGLGLPQAQVMDTTVQQALLQQHITSAGTHDASLLVLPARLFTLQGPPKSADKLSAARKAVGFDRTPDGRVLLISDDGEPFQVKPDMGVPGALLLR